MVNGHKGWWPFSFFLSFITHLKDKLVFFAIINQLYKCLFAYLFEHNLCENNKLRYCINVAKDTHVDFTKYYY